MSAILNAMGRLLQAVPWWEIVVATVGGVVVGVFAFQTATWFGASLEDAKNVGLVAGGIAAGGIIARMLF